MQEIKMKARLRKRLRRVNHTAHLLAPKNNCVKKFREVKRGFPTFGVTNFSCPIFSDNSMPAAGT